MGTIKSAWPRLAALAMLGPVMVPATNGGPPQVFSSEGPSASAVSVQGVARDDLRLPGPGKFARCVGFCRRLCGINPLCFVRCMAGCMLFLPI